MEGLNAFEGGLVVSTHDARLVEGLDECEVWGVRRGEEACGDSRRREGSRNTETPVAAEVGDRVGGGARAKAASRREKAKRGEKVTERRVGAETHGEPRGMPHSSRTVRE